MEEVVPVGGGSSFDGARKHQSASEMKVLERWQHFRDEPAFQSLFDDPEIARLSRAIFGEIPGVREWLDSIGRGA
jgi:hypothetical protein